MDSLTEILLKPEYISFFADEFMVQFEEMRRRYDQEQQGLKTKLAKVEKKIGAIIDAIESGIRTDRRLSVFRR